MQNPLDTAGNAVKETGNFASEVLFGLARFLEQLTGDATSAAIFAGFVIFSLGLLKVVAQAKNAKLYALGLSAMGGIGIVGATILKLLKAYSESIKSTYPSDDLGARIAYKVMTDREWGKFYLDEFTHLFGQSIYEVRWYLMILLVILTSGMVLWVFTRRGQISPKTEPSEGQIAP